MDEEELAAATATLDKVSALDEALGDEVKALFGGVLEQLAAAETALEEAGAPADGEAV